MEKVDFGKFLTKDSIVVLLGKDKKSVFDQLYSDFANSINRKREPGAPKYIKNFLT